MRKTKTDKRQEDIVLKRIYRRYSLPVARKKNHVVLTPTLDFNNFSPNSTDGELVYTSSIPLPKSLLIITNADGKILVQKEVNELREKSICL